METLCTEPLNFIKPGKSIMHWMNIPMTLLQVLNCIQEQICKRSLCWKYNRKEKAFLTNDPIVTEKPLYKYVL